MLPETADRKEKEQFVRLFMLNFYSLVLVICFYFVRY